MDYLLLCNQACDSMLPNIISKFDCYEAFCINE